MAAWSCDETAEQPSTGTASSAGPIERWRAETLSEYDAATLELVLQPMNRTSLLPRAAVGALAVLVLSLVAGCGNPEPAPQSAEPAAPPLKSLDAAKEEPTATLIESEDGSTRVVKEDEAAGASPPAE
jgi:hypothetical protein